MPRTHRYNKPGAVYHLISRFVNNEWLIETDEERAAYLQLLGAALRTSDWRCLAYAVMSNHIHLAMIGGYSSLASWIRKAHSPFAEWTNRRRNRIGAVFTRGPKDYRVRPENVGKTIAYIHNNPVRAGVVGRAIDSSWTSHAAYCGLEQSARWLHVDEGLELAGFGRADEFDQWVNTGPGEKPNADLASVRAAARLHGPIELGTPTIGDDVEVPLLMRPFSPLRPHPKAVVEATAAELGMALVDLCSRRRSPAVVFGRRVAVACGLEAGLTGADIAAALGVSQQAVTAMRRRGLDSASTLGATQRVRQRLLDDKLRK